MDNEQPNIWFVFQRHCRVHCFWNVRHFHKTKCEFGRSFLQDQTFDGNRWGWRTRTRCTRPLGWTSQPHSRSTWLQAAYSKGCNSLAIHIWRCEEMKMSQIITGILPGWNHVLNKLIHLTSMSILLRTNSRGRYNWGLPLWPLLWAWNHNSSSLRFQDAINIKHTLISQQDNSLRRHPLQIKCRKVSNLHIHRTIASCSDKCKQINKKLYNAVCDKFAKFAKLTKVVSSRCCSFYH